MSTACPSLVIAGTASGVGKTSIALGLVRALVRRGMRVQPFKVGPDFLDPTYLTLSAGRICCNIDSWMTSRAYIDGLFARMTADAEIAIVEGAMGLFDGADPATLSGSTAEVAAFLKAPVLLVANAQGSSRSLAAMVKGFAEFEPEVAVAGVIANRCGSDRHREWLAESLKAAGLPPLVGAIPRGAMPELSSRHLGLVTADTGNLPSQTLDKLADACEKYLDIESLLKMARSKTIQREVVKQTAKQSSWVRLGIARDEAFHFYYPDNLEMLEQAGAELVEFSPLTDKKLPEGLDGLYLGGGYPEECAEELSSNEDLREAIQQFASSGRAVYAECGGLMYLSQSIQTRGGKILPMCQVLPFSTRMLDERKSLGYVEVTIKDHSLLGSLGTVLRGHEFHYSEIIGQSVQASDNGWRRVYELKKRRTQTVEMEGHAKDGVLASYVHVHFGSCPQAAEALVKSCGGST